MADIHITEVMDLVDVHVDWRSRGQLPPHQLLAISLSEPRRPHSDELPTTSPSEPRSVADPDGPYCAELAGKHLSYEAAGVTVILDFDSAGFLERLEFV